MSKQLTDYKVLTFDCYGTLIDWETGLWDAVQPLLTANPTQQVTRSQLLSAYAKIEPAIQQAEPELLYERVLEQAHRQLAATLQLTTTPDKDREFSQSLAHWPAFPDTAEALRDLSSRFRLVVLSNISNHGFAKSLRKLGVTFDAVYTAEDIGSYKPHPANFRYLLEHLKADFGIEPSQILHTAQSLYHDHAPANRFGIASAWIDRQRLSMDGEWGATAELSERPNVDFTFFSMREMADAAADADR